VSTCFRRARSGLYVPALTGYATAVLADAPWGFWQCTETSGTTFVDASGNGRNMTLSGSGWTLNQIGPASSMPSVVWPAGDGNSANTTATFNSATGTVEAWVYLTANPSVDLSIAACQNNGGGSLTKFLKITSAGLVFFGTTASVGATSASALALNTWHHIVGSVGAAGTKLRIDKVTVGTAAATTSSTSALAAAIHRKLGGGTTTPGAVTIAAVAVWASQLSDAQTDAHYDAMAISLVGFGGSAATEKAGGGSTLTVPYPASGIAAGDVAVAYVSSNSSLLMSDNNGWTVAVTHSGGPTDTVVPSITLLWKVMTGSENGTNATITLPSTAVAIGRIAVWRGVSNSNPIDVTATFRDQTTASTTQAIPTLTPTIPGAVLIAASCLNSTTALITSIAGAGAFTLWGNLVSGTRAAGVGYYMFAGGATGTVTVTWNASARGEGVMLALRPAHT